LIVRDHPLREAATPPSARGIPFSVIPGPVGILLILLLALSASAQEKDEVLVPLTLRVVAAGPGPTVIVDRGSVEGVNVGDEVLFHPRTVVVVDSAGKDGMAAGEKVLLHPGEDVVYRGIVIKTKDAASEVELEEKSIVPAPGSRGEVRVPRARLTRPGSVPPEDPYEQGEWTSDMPLLAQVRPVRPEDRDRRITGRFYLSADLNHVSGSDGGSDSFYRMGTDLRMENPFGQGGELRFDGELNHRGAHDPDEADRSVSIFRLDRLSYTLGGTRFDDDRVEVGRFLHRRFPELGLLDGIEWSRRLESGSRLGASAGWLPELDKDLDTGEDLQFSVFYEWVADDAEELTLGAALQKSWHKGDRDRDLLVTKLRYLPTEHWNLHATLWVDFYGSSDDAKDGFVDLTQAYVLASRRWGTTSELDVSYRRIKFPELLRQENPFLPPAEIEKDRLDRIDVSGWKRIDGPRRLRGRVGVWNDENDTGADVSAGIDWEALLQSDSRTGLTAFATAARFENVVGGRITYGRSLRRGRWDILYEIAGHREEGFSSSFDDILQQRLRGSLDLFFTGGWSLSFYGQASLWDDDTTVSAGAYVQKSF